MGRAGEALERAPRNRFLRALDGAVEPTPPVWLMRQAGRYLPEYRELRASAGGFLDLCYNPRLAAEVTLQPVRRFGFDAAILFSDILVVPDALGQSVAFESGEGPRLAPIADAAGLAALRDTIDLSRLEPVLETVARVRGALTPDVALIGFCGAPWTVASYMIAGMGTPDQAPARLFAYRRPDLFGLLIDRLVDASATYLLAQFEAGAEVVQIFDSWAGVLPPAEFDRWCVQPVLELVRRVRAVRPDAPIIAFPRGAGLQIGRFAAAGFSGIGLDTAADASVARAMLPGDFALQGNLDPLALVAGGARLDENIDRVLADFSGRAHIFNLGHGVLPDTPIDHVSHLVRRVRAGPS